jgi:hypothetical protein
MVKKTEPKLRSDHLEPGYKDAVIQAVKELEAGWSNDAKSKHIRERISEKHPEMCWGVFASDNDSPNYISYSRKDAQYLKVEFGSVTVTVFALRSKKENEELQSKLD